MRLGGPSLQWVATRKNNHESAAYFHPNLDSLLHIPGHGDRSYIGRGLHRIRGNILRGRAENRDAIDIWYLDANLDMEAIVSNQTLHSYPSPLADAWGETIWEGPMVVTMREGNTFDPPLVKDIDLTAYRDAIDFLGYYRDGCGSMVDGIGKGHHLAKQVLEERVGKVMGWRLNCANDQSTRNEPAMVPVAVPKAHPLFISEGDDPLKIPSILGFEWVVRAYSRGQKEATELENKMARLLLLRIAIKDGKWEGPRSHWNNPAFGSVLLVHRRRGEVKQDTVLAICKSRCPFHFMHRNRKCSVVSGACPQPHMSDSAAPILRR
ncbi:hypothetical protein HIM_09559 [Hirsutella minnesotensis 3608]|uniref:Uncharacterized protein n=1 Tax=Hirsutella minnesotensis 3608 TaxID=1043627 RepID=A0A0F7ZXN5_9HYPO|nr:hypothetical protein HIM_09559 [Hirsutella minnesotensis 3608]